MRPPPATTCEARGGSCQTPDLPCEPGTLWAGGDLCGTLEQSACCVPEVRRDLPVDPPEPPIDEPDAGAEVPALCIELCGHDCGPPSNFLSGDGACEAECSRLIDGCGGTEVVALEACLEVCDMFEPCVSGVRCVNEPIDGIACGTGVCEVGTEMCRHPIWDGDGEPSCVAKPEDGGRGVGAFFAHCDGPEDCETGGCIVQHGSTASWAVCGDRVELCHSLADCPAGATDCGPTEGVPQYWSCSGAET